MKDMKLTEADQEKTQETISIPKPRFPYGLSVHLEDDSLKKLGIDKLPKVGETMMLSAKVKAESVGEHQMSGDKKRRHVTLQITHMELKGDKGERESDAKVIYGLPGTKED